MDGHIFRAIIAGHSYVKRFNTYLFETDHHRIQPNLGLQNFEMFYDGVGGRHILGFVNDILIRKIKKYGPQIICLQLGEIEIYNGVRPETVASSIEELVQTLRFAYNIKCIIVCELIQWKIQSDKHKHISICNQVLQTLIDDLPFAIFWKHRRIHNSQYELFDAKNNDYVHFNEIGNHRLYQSFRLAMIHAENHLLS